MSAMYKAPYLCLHVRSLWYAPRLHFSWSTFIAMAMVDPGLRLQILAMRPLPPPVPNTECALLPARARHRKVNRVPHGCRGGAR